MIAHADLVDRIDTVDTAALQTLIVSGPVQQRAAVRICLPFEALDGRVDAFNDPSNIEPWDLHAVIYTSGTTGPSKGVMQSYQHIATYSAVSKGYLRPDDHMLVNLPMFHVAGTMSFYGVLRAGASLTVADGFSVSTFWRQVRETNATCVPVLMGAMIWFLMKAESNEADAARRIRMTCLNPASRETIAFARQLGFGYFASYSMTELSGPLIAEMDNVVENSCGRVRTGVECRLVDEHDIEVPVGSAGELILRIDQPWTLTSGYLNNPEATARAWRNGWFHTGDLMRRDIDGNFFFIDRLKDALRRRGENISSVEVEAEALAHPAVLEAAAVATASAQGEDEILLCVAPRPGCAIDATALIQFMAERMAYFMVPRYVRVMDSLPKTESGKVRKVPLREEGLTEGVWDREASGLVLKRDRLAQY
jgi:crotonobetaine/carnitine-CoA ligase